MRTYITFNRLIDTYFKAFKIFKVYFFNQVENQHNRFSSFSDMQKLTLEHLGDLANYTKLYDCHDTIMIHLQKFDDRMYLANKSCGPIRG